MEGLHAGHSSEPQPHDADGASFGLHILTGLASHHMPSATHQARDVWDQQAEILLIIADKREKVNDIALIPKLAKQTAMLIKR